MYAVIRDRSKSRIVRVGDEIRIDLKPGLRPGDEISFEAVYLGGEEGGRVGKPAVAGVAVVGEVRGEEKGDKVYPYRWRRRHGFRRKRGHRQRYLRVRIRDIRQG